MRLFYALSLPQALCQQVRQAQAALPQRDWRLVPVDHLHLTLRFLGEVDPARLPELAELGEMAAARPPLQLELGELGGFPDARYAKVAWLAIRGAGLGELAEVLSAAGGDDKPFAGHLTIARSRAGGQNLEMVQYQVQRVAWRAEEFFLIQSTLTPTGPIYQVKARCAFQSEV